MPLQPILARALFEKWGLDFIGPINPPTQRANAKYILVATDFVTKWTKAKLMRQCDTRSTARFLYKVIIVHFHCSLEIVSDQESSFLNQTIKYPTSEFLIQYKKSSPYYPRAYGQVESTNKILKITLTKICNVGQTD